MKSAKEQPARSSVLFVGEEISQLAAHACPIFSEEAMQCGTCVWMTPWNGIKSDRIIMKPWTPKMMYSDTSVTYPNIGLPTKERQGDLKTICHEVHWEQFLNLSTIEFWAK